MNTQYEIVRNNPLAKFYYKGKHSHPVQRTVLVVEAKNNLLVGYELREGKKTRDFSEAPIKSYKKSKIAKLKHIDKRNKLRIEAENLNQSTLIRGRLFDLIKNGA